MPSCGDIPEALLGRENWKHFVNWVHLFYHSQSDRKTIGTCWAKMSKVPLTAEMWKELLHGKTAHYGL